MGKKYIIDLEEKETAYKTVDSNGTSEIAEVLEKMREDAT